MCNCGSERKRERIWLPRGTWWEETPNNLNGKIQIFFFSPYPWCVCVSRVACRGPHREEKKGPWALLLVYHHGRPLVGCLLCHREDVEGGKGPHGLACLRQEDAAREERPHGHCSPQGGPCRSATFKHMRGRESRWRRLL